MKFGQRIAVALITRAIRTPYSHLEREDGTTYMRRFWLVPYDYIPSFGPIGCGPVGWDRPIAKVLQLAGIAIRVHHIMAPDRDRHLHDHPWHSISVVLRGWYVEHRPHDPGEPKRWAHSIEWFSMHRRETGDVCFRRPSDRHTIAQVPVYGVWTLFITFRKRQEWGFYTPTGKVHHTAYHGAHHISHGTTQPDREPDGRNAAIS